MLHGLEEELSSSTRRLSSRCRSRRRRSTGNRLKPEFFDAVLELNTEPCATVAAAAIELERLRREAASARVRPDSPSPPARPGPRRVRGAGGHVRRRLAPVRGVRGPLGAASALLGAPCPRGRGEPRSVHGRARGRPSVAPARAGLLGELALRRLGGDRARLDAGGDAEPASPRGCASRLRRATRPGRASPRRSSGSGSRTRSRVSGGTFVRIRISARSSPHAGPADQARGHGGVCRTPAGARRGSATRPSGDRGSTPRTGGRRFGSDAPLVSSTRRRAALHGGGAPRRADSPPGGRRSTSSGRPRSSSGCAASTRPVISSSSDAAGGLKAFARSLVDAHVTSRPWRSGRRPCR